VHDLLRRSSQVMEDFERRLGLLAQDRRRRDEAAALTRELDALRRRVGRMT
jgi:predicted DNA-binding protein YlxM (UPF0122 family)